MFTIGALNLTREAYNKTLAVKGKNSNTENTIAEATKSCKRTEALILKHNSQYSDVLEEDEKKLLELTKYVNDLEADIPNLNLQVRY